MQIELQGSETFKVPLKWYFDREIIDVNVIPKEELNNDLNDDFKQIIPIF